MAKRRKSGLRTKSGRLSRAYTDPRVRDHGTPEATAKRQALVGVNGDPNLSASAPGMLYAHGYLDAQQYAEALEYRRLRCILYGSPWPAFSASSDPCEERLASLQERFDRKASLLTEYQKHVITAVAVFDERPNWFFARKLGLKILPEDLAEQDALVSGLDAMLGRHERKAA